MKESHFRSVAKGISWRITGTLDTMLLSYIFTGSPFTALKIGFSELFTKIPLYYVHERIWGSLKVGRKKIEMPGGEIIWADAHSRSLIKGISWRFFGTLDTITLAVLWTHDFRQAFSIGFAELFTKVLLFYLHERAWHFVSWGKPREAVQVMKKESADAQMDFSA